MDNDAMDPDLLDLVEPVTTRRLRELTIQLLQIHEEGHVPRRDAEAAAGIPRYAIWAAMMGLNRLLGSNLPAVDRFREYQLVDCGDEAANGPGDAEDAREDESVRDDRALPRLLLIPPDDDDDARAAGPAPGDGGMGIKLVSFLMKDDSETRVVWLTHSQFLACRRHDVDHQHRPVLPGYLEQDFPWKLQANVSTESGRTYTFLMSFPYYGPASFDADAEPRSRLVEDAWPTILLTLFARTPTVTAIRLDHCRFNVNSCGRSLMAIVSPPPPHPGGRILDIDVSYDVRLGDDELVLSAEAARVLAFGTHRDTAVVVECGSWGDRISILAEAIRLDQCPKRLMLTWLSSLPERLASELAGAIGSTTAVESIDVTGLLGSQQDRMLLDAIRKNVGIRSVVADGGVGRSFVKDFWSSVLRNRTVERVHLPDGGGNMRNPPAPSERREYAQHVVDLLRCNRSVTDIQYSSRIHDADLMERHAVPLLYLNRLRKFDQARGNDISSAAMNLERVVPALLRSAAVRRHSLLRFYVLRRNVDIIVSLLDASASRELGRRRSDAPRPANEPRSLGAAMTRTSSLDPESD
jgi:hypothetical protein